MQNECGIKIGILLSIVTADSSQNRRFKISISYKIQKFADKHKLGIH